MCRTESVAQKTRYVVQGSSDFVEIDIGQSQEPTQLEALLGRETVQIFGGQTRTVHKLLYTT
jgi:hypothetical protein